MIPLAFFPAIVMVVCMSGAAVADEVTVDDVITTGSTCTGFDCVNNEDFSFDTLRLKENNLRIHFSDTSNAGSFPTTDWRIVANDTVNGGRNRFSVEDASAGREVFTLMGGAPDFSLYIQDTGEVGIGTNNPQRAVHVLASNTPSIRLEQGGGVPTQTTWDIEANEQQLAVSVNGESRLVIDANGGVTIEGSLTTVRPVGTFPDYVFAPGYPLMGLNELSDFLVENRHLPGVPSAAEVQEQGVNVTELQLTLLKKVEELTLYVLKQQAEIEALRASR